MESQQKFVKNFKLILSNYDIFSIAGSSGTGKTTLALYIIGHLLKTGSCIWIQASEKFPKRRVLSMFKNNAEKLNYLLNHIYIVPDMNACKNYYEQSRYISALLSGDIIIPPKLKLIVIDSISHHLRFISSNCENKNNNKMLLNDFFTQMIYPLIMFCQREHILLIFIHEVSFNPNLGKNVPYFNSLFSRIASFNIFLSKSLFSRDNLMEISLVDGSLSLKYKIIEEGIFFIG